MSELRYAQRVTTKAAREHFNAGGVVVVSDRGHLSEIAVGPSTTTHDRTRGTFDQLAAIVKDYGDPRQRYYALANATTTAVDLVDDDTQTCSRCEDTVATLSTYGLCDGCVEEEAQIQAARACPTCGQPVRALAL